MKTIILICLTLLIVIILFRPTSKKELKKFEDYDNAGVDNIEEATNEGNPSWFTLNTTYTTKIDESLSFSFGVKNILDAHYKLFGSGLSSSGRNFTVSLHTYF